MTERSSMDRSGAVATGVVAAGWVLVLALILRHRVFVSHDSISNYTHVWYVGDRLWHGHGIPLHMPVVGHGRAFAFPYAFVPWLSAAFLWPLLGDWVVTLWLVLGFLGVVAATFWAFPELRSGWWAAAVLVNPILVAAPIIGQLPFLWAMAFLILAIGMWRRGRRWEAGVFAALGQITHPAVVLPIAAGLVAGWIWWERDRAALLRTYAISVLLTLPAAALVWASPVFTDADLGTKVRNFSATVAVRMEVLAIPLVMILLQRWLHWRVLPVLVFIGALIPNFLLIEALDAGYAWNALGRSPDQAVARFTRTPAFVPGATYRILRAADGKVGMYQLVRGRARLDSELFPESIERRSWTDDVAYSAFLERRHVDQVLIFDSYDREYRTNEHALLERLGRRAAPSCGPAIASARLAARAAHYDVYAVTRPACSSPSSSSSQSR